MSPTRQPPRRPQGRPTRQPEGRPPRTPASQAETADPAEATHQAEAPRQTAPAHHAAPPETAPATPVPHEPLPGPTNRTLTHRERIHWHFHREHQLIHPSHGVLRVFTAAGAWVVPPHRAVWVPAGVAHAHQAHGHTRMRTLAFPAKAAPLRTDRPTVLAVGPLLREVIVSLSDEAAAPGRTARQRRTLEQVALDELRQADDLPLLLPAPADDRLRSVAALLHEDPADPRTLAELGAAVGAGERTLSRLFRREMGMSFPQWRTQLRLHHSLILLAAGTSVTATATACGYTHTSAFIEAFRHAFGTTPGRHRQPALP